MEMAIAIFVGLWLFGCGYAAYRKLKKDYDEADKS